MTMGNENAKMAPNADTKNVDDGNNDNNDDSKSAAASNNVAKKGEEEGDTNGEKAIKEEGEDGKTEKEETKDGKSAEISGKRKKALLPSKPVKRARTAYFIFMDENRPKVQAEHGNQSVAAVAKVMGQMWGALSDEEKSVYQQKAAEERERVAKEVEAWREAGGQIEVEGSGEASTDPDALIIPAARIRKICKLDPEVGRVSPEVLGLISKCAELVTAKLGKEAVRVAQLQNRRKLLPEDVAHVCAHREQFFFLKDDIKDLLRSMDQDQPAANTTKKSDAAREAAAAGSKPLTSYFGSTKSKAAS